MNIKRTPIALAVSALLASPLLMAQEPAESYSVSVTNSGSVGISSTVDSQTVLRTRAVVDLNLTSKSQAVVDDKQLGSGNVVINNAHDNNAGIGGTAGNGARGNIGVNTAAGDNNMQDNAAAIAAADAYFVFGSAESRTMTTQLTTQNVVQSLGSSNNAIMDGGFAGAAGNIGINTAAGNNNMQKNNLAISTAPSRVSTASVQNVQRSRDNVGINSARLEQATATANITLNASGVTGTYSGDTRGNTRGISDQIGDVYPDIWTGTTHPDGTQIGHVDLDSQAQGAQDINGDGGALAFTNRGGYRGSETGNLALSGTIAGTVEIPVQQVVVNSVNNAHLRGDALNGASGNIGVNIAAGNGNLQNNSLSMAVSQAPVAAPTVGGGGAEVR